MSSKYPRKSENSEEDDDRAREKREERSVAVRTLEDNKASHNRRFHLPLLEPFRSLEKEKVGTAVVISIIIASYVLFFLFQITSEFATLGEVFSSSREEQFATVQNLAKITSLKFNTIEGIMGRIDSSTTGSRILALPSSPSATGTTPRLTTTLSDLDNNEEIRNELFNSVENGLAMALGTMDGDSSNKNNNNNGSLGINGPVEITIVDRENKVVESKVANIDGDEGNNRGGPTKNTNEPLFKAGGTLEYSWAKDVQKFHMPKFSGSFEAADIKDNAEATTPETGGVVDNSTNDENNDQNKGGSKVISFAQPLFDAGNDSSYAGMLVLTLPARYLTEDYDSVINSASKEVALLDSNQLTYVMTTTTSTTNNSNSDSDRSNIDTGHLHPNGASFGDDIKEIQSGDDPKSVIASDRFKASGGDVVFKNADGEFLISGFPVYYYGKPQYMLIFESATSDFYAKVEPILFQGRIQMFSILTATAVLTVIIASFISHNINLDRQVREKTKEITKSNETIVAQKQQLEKANEELRHLDALKTQFIGIASHELKNPIQPIILYAEMAKYGDVEKDEAIDVILRQAQRLRQLSADILEVSRIDSNNLVLNKQKVRIGSLIREIVRPYQVTDIEKNGTVATESVAAKVPNNNNDTTAQMPNIVINIDEDTEMSIDALRISQVMNNIIQNAIKFTMGGGTVTIRKSTVTPALTPSILGDASFRDKAAGATVSQSPSSSAASLPSRSFVEIVISDTGPGIPREIMPKLFGKFVTKDVNSLNKHGTGLGLYISKAIVEAHGGQISAYNNSNKDNDGQEQHRGASFRILLPL